MATTSKALHPMFRRGVLVGVFVSFLRGPAIPQTPEKKSVLPTMALNGPPVA
jgi:hypothetical protein